MRLLLDTHVLIWMPSGDPRMSRAARDMMADASSDLFVSAVTAFELSDLQRRGRIAMTENIDQIANVLQFSTVDFPADAWRVIERLPKLHADLVDRMLIAHAIAGGYTLITADRTARRYPVETLW